RHILPCYGHEVDARSLFAEPGSGDVGGDRVAADGVRGRLAKDVMRARDCQTKRLPAVFANVTDRPAYAYPGGMGVFLAQRVAHERRLCAWCVSPRRAISLSGANWHAPCTQVAILFGMEARDEPGW